MTTIRANTVLPASRRPITLTTADGLRLVGELALPEGRSPAGTIICLHPLPTAGGMMDSHLFRKASWRLPALADLAVLRFNTRGTTSAAGSSEGSFDNGNSERLDVEAAIDFAVEQDLPNIWVVGWSFGTDLALRFARSSEVRGLILLSPPLRFSEPADLAWWSGDGRAVIALVPEFDDFLRPDPARQRFAAIPQAQVIPIENGKHLWVGEPLVVRALSEIVERVNPDALPLPSEWDGPYDVFTDLPTIT